MQIHGPSHVSGAQPANSVHKLHAPQPAAPKPHLAPVDQLDISHEAEMLSQMRETSDVRQDLVNRIRAEIDDRSDKVGAKIRDAELHKVPYMFVVGAKEVEAKAVSLRKHGTGDIGTKSLEDAIGLMKQEIESKGLTDL